MHIYWASSFLIPSTCIKILEQHVRNFFGGSFKVSKNLKLVDWKKICSIYIKGGSVSSLLQRLQMLLFKDNAGMLLAGRKAFGLNASIANTSRLTPFGILWKELAALGVGRVSFAAANWPSPR